MVEAPLDMARERARLVYFKTDQLATRNMTAQGLSGLVGMGVNLLVDVAAVPFYVRHWNDIRALYGRGAISLEGASAYLRPNLGFIVEDLVFDKALGSIPVVGVYFNAAFAKALTWRLGAWFGVLCALGDEEDQPSELLTRASMQLTREMFAADIGSFNTLSFPTPDEETFVRFIASTDGLTQDAALERIQKALDALAGAAD